MSGQSSDKRDQRDQSMSHAELLAAVEAGGLALIDNGLRVNNIGFVLAATPAGLAAFKLVNCNEDNETLRTSLAATLRDFASQVEDGRIHINAQRAS